VSWLGGGVLVSWLGGRVLVSWLSGGVLVSWLGGGIYSPCSNLPKLTHSLRHRNKYLLIKGETSTDYDTQVS
jgi:hypothetical protein